MNIRDMFEGSVAAYAEQPAVQFKRNGTWLKHSYKELKERIRKVAALLEKNGIAEGDSVGMFMENGALWPEIYFGIVCAGCVAVPVDAKLQPRELGHVLHDAGVKFLFSSSRLLGVIEDVDLPLPGLMHIITTEKVGPDSGSVPRESYETAVADIGEDHPAMNRYDNATLSHDVVASIIYTSGTTGRSKGAMLTHGNFASQVTSVRSFLQVTTDDMFMVVLPLHHAFSFMCNLMLPLGSGASLAFVESLRTIAINMKEVQPTIMVGVPLLFEKIRNRIMGQIQSARLPRLMYKFHIRKPIFKKIHAGLGGNLRILVSGGAPGHAEVLQWYNQLGPVMLEGYGLTETAPVLSVNRPEKVKYGTVGPAIPGVTLRIDKPNAEGVGEIQATGPGIFKGYYGNEAATEEVMNEEWFCTGDLGTMDSEGFVTITGRKKCLIVNREGKNIYPEEVEQVISENPFIAEVLVLGVKEGVGRGEKVGAIIVPSAEELAAWQEQHRMLNDEELEKFVIDEVKRSVRELSDYKRPRHIVVRHEEFEKTSTMKVKRYLYQL